MRQEEILGPIVEKESKYFKKKKKQKKKTEKMANRFFILKKEKIQNVMKTRNNFGTNVKIALQCFFSYKIKRKE